MKITFNTKHVGIASWPLLLEMVAGHTQTDDRLSTVNLTPQVCRGQTKALKCKLLAQTILTLSSSGLHYTCAKMPLIDRLGWAMQQGTDDVRFSL